MAGSSPFVFTSPGQPVMLPALVGESRFLDFYSMMERLIREALARGSALRVAQSSLSAAGSLAGPTIASKNTGRR
jgi:hypothetical protein